MAGEARSLSISSLPSLPRPNKKKVLLIISVSASAAILLVGIAVAAVYVIFRIKNTDDIEAWELDVGPHRFPYGELKKATKGFGNKELVGFGGFGRVYKGILLTTNTEVAIKRISHEREFMSEIASIGRLFNIGTLGQLLGWCRHRRDFLLVFNFMPNGSLVKYIFDKPKAVLCWDQRFKIIKDAASGFLYLHEEWDQAVIHRDVKTGNVLLDTELNGRMGDFGLAKLYENDKGGWHIGLSCTRANGTGKPTTSSGVFAFGALLLEDVCGRRPIEPKALPEELILVDWVWEKWVSGAIYVAVDSEAGRVIQ